MGLMICLSQGGLRSLSASSLQCVAAAYTVRGATYNPEPFGVAFHHLGPTLIVSGSLSPPRLYIY